MNRTFPAPRFMKVYRTPSLPASASARSASSISSECARCDKVPHSVKGFTPLGCTHDFYHVLMAFTIILIEG